MFNEDILEVLNLHKPELVEKTATLIYERAVPGYSDFELPKLNGILNAIYEIVFKYLATNDSEQYRNAIISAVENRIAEGFSGEEIVSLSSIMAEVMHEVFDRERAEEEAESIRQRMSRRLDGTITLTHTTVLATRLKLKAAQEVPNLS